MSSPPDHSIDYATYERILGVANLGFSGTLSSSEFLRNIWDGCSKLWSENDPEIKTSHGMEHSFDLTQKFIELDPIYNWSSYEKLIFGAASLLHDVGMNFNAWKIAGEDLLKEFFLVPPSFPSPETWIKQNHIELGARLAYLHLLKFNEEEVPDELSGLFSLETDGKQNAFSRAMHIAFAHSGEEYINRLIKEEATWTSRRVEGDYFRPRLLAAILIICDELTATSKRIKDQRSVFGWDLANTSNVHWASCVFVVENRITVDLLIEKHPKINIQMIWRVPRDSGDEVIEKIRIAVEQSRIYRLKQEINRVSEFMNDCNESGFVRPSIRPLVATMPELFYFPGGKKLGRLTDRILELGKSSTPEIDHIVKVEERVLPQKIQKDDYSKYVGAEIVQALKLFFEENKELDHWELRYSREHTDTYLHTRNIISHQDLLETISEKIAELTRGYNIGSVLGVGTSVISIAVNAAAKLNAEATFTLINTEIWSKLQHVSISEPLTTKTIGKEYTPFEIIPALPESKNILAIDDIISGGHAYRSLIEFLFKLGVKAENIFHLPVYRLGTRSIETLEGINQLEALCHIPEVNYYDGEHVCPRCKNGDNLRKEEIHG